MTDVLADIVLIFGAALVATLVARAIRAPAIIGFLLAGIAIGPSGLDFVHEHDVHALADLGLVLLLFTVGLELSPAPLIQMGGRLLLATAIQIGATAGVGTLVLWAFCGVPIAAAIVVGLVLTPASTAIVLKQLSDRGELESASGAVSTGVLLLQDVAMILLLLLLPILGAPGGAAWGPVLKTTALALGGLLLVVVAARFVMPILVRVIFRESSREVMTLFAVVTAITGAWLASAAGWSPALGAAVAGLVLAATDVRHQLFAEIMPFREVFNALFFVSIGMLADLTAARAHLFPLLASVAAVIVVKAILAAVGVRVAGWPSRVAVAVGLGLCTVSEFGYVVAAQAAAQSLISQEWLGVVVLLAVGTMFLGAALVPLSTPLSLAMALRSGRGEAGESPESGPLSESSQSDKTPTANAASGRAHVIIVGYGLNGRNLAGVLRSTGIPYVVVEMNPGLVKQARSSGAKVVLGDAARRTILDHAGLSSARAVVICINDQAATRRIVAQVRIARSDVFVLARTRYVSELEALYRLGANVVIPEEFETSVEIFAHVLTEFGVPDNVVEQQIHLVRAGHYGMLRGRPQDRAATQEWLRLLEVSATRTFLLPAESPFAGKTIRESELRASTGVTIVALTRSGKPIGNPSPDTRLEGNDVLVLVGAHAQIEAAKRRLAPGADAAG